MTDFPDRFVTGLTLSWRRDEVERELTIASVRPHGGRILVRFDGIDDADAARALGSGDLWVAEDRAVPAPEGFYYSHQVEGWRCEDTEGRELGRVRTLERTAGGPMLSIDTGRPDPVAVPFTRPIVVSVDPEGRRVILDPPEGLLDL